MTRCCSKIFQKQMQMYTYRLVEQMYIIWSFIVKYEETAGRSRTASAAETQGGDHVVTAMQMPQFISSLGVSLLGKEKHIFKPGKKIVTAGVFPWSHECISIVGEYLTTSAVIWTILLPPYLYHTKLS